MLKRVFPLTIITFLAFAVPSFAQKATTVNKPKPKPTAPAAAIKCVEIKLTADEITELLAGQNKARGDVKLPPLVWDCKLATIAQQWAERGVFEHRPDAVYGENLFVSSSPTEPISTVIKMWLKEKADWTNANATCAKGKICTHYTQMVWNRTTKVGCGINRNAPGTWKTMLVCNYEPAGNRGGPAY